MAAAANVHIDHLPGRTLLLNGVEHLFCSGTSYLGISSNKEFQQLLIEGMQRYGTNYSSSRNSNLQLKMYEEVEAYLADYTGAEAALTMSSGYLAGQALVQTLQGSGYFIYAPATHPAVWRSSADATDPKQTHEAWVVQLLQEVSNLTYKHIVIVCNSLDPLKARSYSFDWMATLPKDKQFTLIVDDSHGFGVTGKYGTGIYGQLTQYAQAVRIIVVSSMGKAFGIPAGVILGDRQLIEQLKANPHFGGASPATPAYLYAFLHSSEVFAEAREKLFSNIASFKQQLEQPELFSFFDHYPVFRTTHEDLCPFLLEHQILISSFRYPTPADEPITRVILNSQHTTEDIQRLTNLINQYEQVLYKP
ncbi:aminotransferase class I/II-fold pyridoxal phosphate-dependent enzyme [Pontibacter harenae]|uniref:aminotransferase class I/II-fold pyridoxal phosphate-dependent enzyme n=1 Tax=Pontibacter harenae TaxID=2894083 RepID=UPI001E434609|nr:aminotransferase class I/II-fold pyridoxal phosphate-dependent enzyme [Pontibacter harenae]MCC9167815.1 aminotransferase class I/II-fold pyridoxal phosphate-dependent enzyme [Pontibacter harenae]